MEARTHEGEGGRGKDAKDVDVVGPWTGLDGLDGLDEEEASKSFSRRSFGLSHGRDACYAVGKARW